VVVKKRDIPKVDKMIAVVTAGTADIPVAEEAAVTCEIMGNSVERVYDVGVQAFTGFLHGWTYPRRKCTYSGGGNGGSPGKCGQRPCGQTRDSCSHQCGYGANFGGLSALLTMLNSCAAGIGVVISITALGRDFWQV